MQHQYDREARMTRVLSAKELAGTSAEVWTYVRAGTAADKIIRAADELGTDLVVVSGLLR